MIGFAFLRTFEGHMLPEMSQSLLKGLFVAAPNVKHNPAVGNLRVQDLFVCNANSVGQGVNFVIFHSMLLAQSTTRLAY